MLSKAEKFALDEWLFAYPNDITYDEIIDSLCNTNSWLQLNLTPWTLVEMSATSDVSDYIQMTKAHFEKVTNDTV